MTVGIYAIENTVSGKVYVGSSKGIEKRIRTHLSALRRSKHCNRHLQSSWDKYGSASFLFYTLELVASESDLLTCEQVWIDHFGDYNIVGATRNRCPPWTSEMRQARSLQMSGSLNTFYGLSHTAESIELISSKAMGNTRCAGRPMPESTRAKIGAANSGPKVITAKFLAAAKRAQRLLLNSPEVRAAVALKATGRKRSPNTVARMRNSAFEKHKAKVSGFSGVIHTFFLDTATGVRVDYTLQA